MYNCSPLLLPSPALQAAALQAAAIVILPIKVQCSKDLFFIMPYYSGEALLLH